MGGGEWQRRSAGCGEGRGVGVSWSAGDAGCVCERTLVHAELATRSGRWPCYPLAALLHPYCSVSAFPLSLPLSLILSFS